MSDKNGQKPGTGGQDPKSNGGKGSSDDKSSGNKGNGEARPNPGNPGN